MAFQHCMDFSLAYGLLITTFISDRHSTIASHMKNVLTNIVHYFDIWHLKKSNDIPVFTITVDCTILHYPSINSGCNHRLPPGATAGHLHTLSILGVRHQPKPMREAWTLTDALRDQSKPLRKFCFFSLCLSTEICKVLLKIAKLKDCEALPEWIKPCERHLHWSATSTFSGNGRVILAMFKGFLNHVINKHSGFSDPLFNKCAHGNIEPQKWLRSGMFIGDVL